MSLYTVLDIGEDASDFELEQAFRARSLQFLTTLDTRDHREFYAVSDAFQILRNSRSEYNANSSNLYWLSDQLQLTTPAVEYFCLLFGMPQMEPFIGCVPVLHWMLNLAPEFPFVEREIKRIPEHILNMLDRARDRRPYDSKSRDNNSRYHKTKSPDHKTKSPDHKTKSRDHHSLFIDPYLRKVSAQAYVLERGQEIDVSEQVDRLRFLLDVDRDGDGNFWEQKWESFDRVHKHEGHVSDGEEDDLATLSGHSARAILLMDRCVDARDRCLKINDFWGKYGLSVTDQVNFMYVTCFYELIREVAMNANRIISQLFEDDETKERRKYKRQRAHRVWEMGDWLVKRGGELACERGLHVIHNHVIRPDDVVSSVVAVVSYMEFVVINHRPYEGQARINYGFEKRAHGTEGHVGERHVTDKKGHVSEGHVTNHMTENDTTQDDTPIPQSEKRELPESHETSHVSPDDGHVSPDHSHVTNQHVSHVPKPLMHISGDKSDPLHTAAASLWTPWAVASCNPLTLADPQKAEEFSSFDFRYEDVFKKKKDECECGVALFQ